MTDHQRRRLERLAGISGPPRLHYYLSDKIESAARGLLKREDVENVGLDDETLALEDEALALLAGLVEEVAKAAGFHYFKTVVALKKKRRTGANKMNKSRTERAADYWAEVEPNIQKRYDELIAKGLSKRGAYIHIQYALRERNDWYGRGNAPAISTIQSHLK